jgi:histidinol dehydrogenase
VPPSASIDRPLVGALAVKRLRDLAAGERETLLARATAAIFDEELGRSVSAVVEDVRANGDAAVVRALERFDGVDCAPDGLRVRPDEIAAAARSVPAGVLAAIRRGLSNIRAFNERVLEGASWLVELEPGVVVGERTRPIASAGLFVPSGKGSFPSVLMHIGTPAVVAGVERVAVVVPPAAGGLEIDPAVLAVADELRLRDVFRANGPAGIAALAYGTETIPKVDKIVGPGSPAVTAAQIQVQAHGCTTVMLFGPSESMTVADDTADPAVLAADLLNEAEHGADSAALVVTPSESLVAALDGEVERQLARLPEPRRAFAASAISRYGGALLVDDLAEACSFANAYAPEHLQIVTRNPDVVLERIEHAGEILLGPTPFSAANYVVGIPATLPTGGFARVSSGVSARTFVKTSSIGRVSGDALESLAPAIVALAEHEGFPAHAAAIRARGFGDAAAGSEKAER